jgi:hypothetical protein
MAACGAVAVGDGAVVSVGAVSGVVAVGAGVAVVAAPDLAVVRLPPARAAEPPIERRSIVRFG